MAATPTMQPAPLSVCKLGGFSPPVLGTNLRSKDKLRRRHREAARLEHLTQFPFIKVKSRAPTMGPAQGPERWPRPPLAVRSSCPTKGESGREGGVHGHPLGEAASPPGSPETSGQVKG